MDYNEIKDDFRMIISHALLGYEDLVSKEDWELVFDGCTQYAIGLAKDKCMEQRKLCAIRIQELNPKLFNHPLDISDAMINAPEPEFKNILPVTQ